jgi:hypothetical protein
MTALTKNEIRVIILSIIFSGAILPYCDLRRQNEGH